MSTKTDIIRNNGKHYVNVTSENSLIKKIILSSIAEDSYAFRILFGDQVDAETLKRMQGTYWARAYELDGTTYSEKDKVVVTTL